MLKHQATIILMAFFLFGSLIAEIAEPQYRENSLALSQKNKKKWKIIDGFRSAKFGMSEKQVIKAIIKDFKIPRNKIKRNTQPSQKTVFHTVTVPNLMEIGGTARINYIFGYKSKRLIHVNIDWGKGVTQKKEQEDLYAAAQLLQNHFTKNKYQKKRYAVNIKVNNKTTIVFRGQDKKNRIIFLRLNSPKIDKGGDKKRTGENTSLTLSYILNVENPDIFDTTK